MKLERPVGGNASARLGTQTARNLVDSIIGLNNAQNSFLSSWVQYEVLRRNLDFDLGTMQLDQLGQWVDPGEIDESIGIRAASVMGIELDCQFCQQIGVSYSTNDMNMMEIPGESVESLPLSPQSEMIDQPGFEYDIPEVNQIEPANDSRLRQPRDRSVPDLNRPSDSSQRTSPARRMLEPIRVSPDSFSSKVKRKSAMAKSSQVASSKPSRARPLKPAKRLARRNSTAKQNTAEQKDRVVQKSDVQRGSAPRSRVDVKPLFTRSRKQVEEVDVAPQAQQEVQVVSQPDKTQPTNPKALPPGSQVSPQSEKICQLAATGRAYDQN